MAVGALAGPALARPAAQLTLASGRGAEAAVLKDGARTLAVLDATPETAEGPLPPSGPARRSRAGDATLVERGYRLPGGGRLSLVLRAAPGQGGTLDLAVTLSSSRPVAVALRPTFRAAAGAQPFALGRDAKPGEFESPDAKNAASPLPVIGLAAGRRAYVFASAATWDHPLPGYAEPHLVIRGQAFAAPLIGDRAHPVRLAPGAPQTWRTLIGVAPSAPPADRVYASALAAELAVSRREGGPAAAVGPDLRVTARDAFPAIAFATAYWARVTAPDGKRSVTPAPHYAPGTWMRDSFWTVLGLVGTPLEKPTEATILASYARVTPSGGAFAGRVPLLIAEPATIAFDDESGLYFLIRMERDARVLGIAPDRPLATRVLRYILDRQVRDGRFLTAGAEPFRGRPFSPNGWLDGYHYPKGEVITANQGLFVLALKAAAKLGVEVPPGLEAQAVQAYRDAYDPALGYMRWLSGQDYKSPDVLIPEALSLLLWDAPLLDDRAVRDTLAAQAWSDYGMRVLATRENGWVPASAFLNTTNEGRADEPPGWYQNGGSWLLWEYLAAYAARRHGDPSACAAMRRSLAAEVAAEPISKEFKLTRIDPALDAIDPGGARVLGSTDGARQGYGWNTAILAFDRDLKAHGQGCSGGAP